MTKHNYLTRSAIRNPNPLRYLDKYSRRWLMLASEYNPAFVRIVGRKYSNYEALLVLPIKVGQIKRKRDARRKANSTDEE
jgi:hypothetical protein